MIFKSKKPKNELILLNNNINNFMDFLMLTFGFFLFFSILFFNFYKNF
jgi:hypothetical protein